jgi:hypothetical protein
MRKYFLIIAACAYCMTLSSQNARPTPVIHLDFFKIAAADKAEYLAMQPDIKKMHEERLKAGKIHAWMLYEVLLPNGAAVEHNFVTVTLLKGYNDLETLIPDMADAFAKAVPDKNFAAFFAQAEKIGNRVQSIFQYNTAGHWQNGAPWADFKYVNASFMKVPEAQAGAFDEAFKHWEKVLNTRSDTGLDVGWQFGKNIHSNNTADLFNYTNFQFFSDFAQSANTRRANWLAAYQKAYPQATTQEIGEKFNELAVLRSVYRDELWKLTEIVKK